MATILITGGTGLVGKALTKKLLRAGHSVIVLTRKVPVVTSIPGIRYASWDIDRKAISLEALQQADHIIHLAGAGVVDKKWTPAYQKEIQDSRIESSRLLVDTLRQNRHGVKSIISMSAIGWYGADKDPSRSFEETDPSDTNFLGETCRLWEESISPVAELGIRLVKLRTGIVLDNEGGALAEFKKPLRFGVAAILGNGKQIISWIHIDDLCRMMMHAVEQQNLQGVFNAVAPVPVNNRTLTLTLAKLMRGRLYAAVHVPSFLLTLILGQRSVEVLKSATVSCKKIQDTGFRFTYPGIEDALKNLVGKQVRS
ncbi:MAG TPA: TIGR01777 family protein [Chitinophagaceae bacterium]|nr:TIGR01777 family protein [Chitinophagaceae bacterium]